MKGGAYLARQYHRPHVLRTTYLAAQILLDDSEEQKVGGPVIGVRFRRAGLV